MSSRSTNTAAELLGFWFHPTEEELVSHYLKEKMQGKDSHFPEIDCCKYEPWDLPALLGLEGFFFSPRHYSYANSRRPNRATMQGYWKITGKTRGIKARHSQAVIGYKKAFTFHIGRALNSHKTKYVMYEYDIAETQLGSKPKQNEDFVLCRLKIKSDPSAKKKDSSVCNEPDPDSEIASYFENQAAADDMIAELEEKLSVNELQENLQMVTLSK